MTLSENPEDRTLAPDEFDRIIRAIDTRYPSGKRNRAILLLLHSTGCSIGEVLHARIDAFSEDMLSFTVPPEGRSGMHVVHLKLDEEWQTLQVALRAWEAVRPAGLAYYFTTFTENARTGRGAERTGRIDVSGVERSLGLYAKRAGIDRRVYPSMLRGSFAARSVAAGSSLPSVMVKFGHTDANRTLER